jgi:hypothetical protein
MGSRRKLEDCALTGRDKKEPHSLLWDTVMRGIKHPPRQRIVNSLLTVDVLGELVKHSKPFLLPGIADPVYVLQEEDLRQKIANTAHVFEQG